MIKNMEKEEIFYRVFIKKIEIMQKDEELII
jgi:hypothetical protein